MAYATPTPFTSPIEGALASLILNPYAYPPSTDHHHHHPKRSLFSADPAERGFSKIAAAASLISVLCCVYFVLRDYRKTSFMPPGPSPVPFLGNKWDLPAVKPWYAFKKWTDTYGALVTVWTGRRPTIVIGDPKVACDLLDRRSAIYSSRPRFVVMGELFTNNDALLTMPHGDKWRKTRKIFHTGLMRKACDRYKPIQEAESQRLALELINSPADFGKHLERYAASVMVCVAYGRRVDDLQEDIIQKIYERMAYMATLNVPGAFWAESFPILKLVPDCLAPWKREVKKKSERSFQLLLDMARQVRGRMELGDAPPSFTKTLWEKYDEKPGELTEREIAYATGSLFGAGSDTSSSTLQSFVLAMTCFPEVAAKAQEEMDRVVGQQRSPTWADERHLPYCNAVITETLRWRPVAVMGGTPHASVKDDFYAGHFIPQGTTILGNLWAIHHNEKYFYDSHRFNPDRYLSNGSSGSSVSSSLDGGNVEPYPHRDGHSAFGWGRRICPGKQLAENSLFITISRILWAFDIRKAKDPVTGLDITPDIFAYTDGFNSKPRPFKCCITPRTPQIRAVIEREAALGARFLDQYKP